MFKKIIWATDGSNAADLSLPHATTLAKDADGELLIVHCEEWIAPGPRSGHYPVHADEDEIKGQAADIGADYRPRRTVARQRDAAAAAHRTMSSACRARRRPRNQRLNLRARGDAGPLQRLSPPSSPTPHLTTA
jgi:nucleotide-binding universal stress UspA family protein